MTKADFIGSDESRAVYHAECRGNRVDYSLGYYTIYWVYDTEVGYSAGAVGRRGPSGRG